MSRTGPDARGVGRRHGLVTLSINGASTSASEVLGIGIKSANIRVFPTTAAVVQVLIPFSLVVAPRVRGSRPLATRGRHVATKPSAARRGPRRRRRGRRLRLRGRRRGLGRRALIPRGPSRRRRLSTLTTESLPERSWRGLKGNTWRGTFRGRRGRRTGLRWSLRRRGGRRTLGEIISVRVPVPSVWIRQSARIKLQVSKTKLTFGGVKVHVRTVVSLTEVVKCV